MQQFTCHGITPRQHSRDPLVGPTATSYWHVSLLDPHVGPTATSACHVSMPRQQGGAHMWGPLPRQHATSPVWDPHVGSTCHVIMPRQEGGAHCHVSKATSAAVGPQVGPTATSSCHVSIVGPTGWPTATSACHVSCVGSTGGTHLPRQHATSPLWDPVVGPTATSADNCLILLFIINTKQQ